jgi:hypothetical protein
MSANNLAKRTISSDYDTTQLSPTPNPTNDSSSIKQKRSNVESGLRVMQPNASNATKPQPVAANKRMPTQTEIENF